MKSFLPQMASTSAFPFAQYAGKFLLASCDQKGTERPSILLAGASFDRIESKSGRARRIASGDFRSEEHTSELQSHSDLVCRLLLEKKKNKANTVTVFHAKDLQTELSVEQRKIVLDTIELVRNERMWKKELNITREQKDKVMNEKHI